MSVPHTILPFFVVLSWRIYFIILFTSFSSAEFFKNPVSSWIKLLPFTSLGFMSAWLTPTGTVFYFLTACLFSSKIHLCQPSYLTIFFPLILLSDNLYLYTLTLVLLYVFIELSLISSCILFQFSFSEANLTFSLRNSTIPSLLILASQSQSSHGGSPYQNSP